MTNNNNNNNNMNMTTDSSTTTTTATTSSNPIAPIETPSIDSTTLLQELTLDDQKAVDTALAEELNKLSVRERELIYEEIHGVERVVPETPAFVASHLQAMDQELLYNIPMKPAYDLAMTMSQAYVTNPKFRVMFLRAENFNVQKAAIRLVKFFEGKLRLFGKETLVRPLLLSDLDDDDRKALDSGCLQWLPARDRSGRVVFLDMETMVPKTWKRGLNVIKAGVYIIMAALEDEETQRRGVVSILYHMGTYTDFDPDLLSEAPAAMQFLPYKMVCIHICFNNHWMSSFSRALLAISGSDFRARARLHSGSHTELQYSLMTFGLPMELFPVTTDGEVKRTNLEKWIAKRKRKEFMMQQHAAAKASSSSSSTTIISPPSSSSSSSSATTLLTTSNPAATTMNIPVPLTASSSSSLTTTTTTTPSITTATATPTLPLCNDRYYNFENRVDMPGRYDVLVGKGKPFQRHVGNVHLRAIVESYVKEYSGVPKGVKAQLARKVFNVVKKDGGRFLKKERDDWWTEVPESDALDKISKLFTSLKSTAITATTKTTSSGATGGGTNNTGGGGGGGGGASNIQHKRPDGVGSLEKRPRLSISNCFDGPGTSFWQM